MKIAPLPPPSPVSLSSVSSPGRSPACPPPMRRCARTSSPKTRPPRPRCPSRRRPRAPRRPRPRRGPRSSLRSSACSRARPSLPHRSPRRRSRPRPRRSLPRPNPPRRSLRRPRPAPRPRSPSRSPPACPRCRSPRRCPRSRACPPSSPPRNRPRSLRPRSRSREAESTLGPTDPLYPGLRLPRLLRVRLIACACAIAATIGCRRGPAVAGRITGGAPAPRRHDAKITACRCPRA